MSPTKVQFESVTVEEQPVALGGGGPNSYNGSTEPLVTDSSNSSESAEHSSPRFDKNSDGDIIQAYQKIQKREIQEQWGYNTKVLNRLKLRYESELVEFNYGIDFTQLKTCKE